MSFYRRTIVVGFIESNGEVLLVKNPRGRRKSWQLPGGAVSFDQKPLLALSKRILEEVGLRIEAKMWKLIKCTPRTLGDVVQTVYLYRVRLNSRSFEQLPEVGPAGHLNRREKCANVVNILSLEDFQLIRDVT